MRVGRGVTRDLNWGLFLQSDSSCISSRESLSDSFPAGNCAALSVIHYCQRRYVLMVAADGTTKEQGCLRDRRYILLHLSFPFLLGLVWLHIWQRQGYYLHLCDQILMRQIFYFCFTFIERLDVGRIKPFSNLPASRGKPDLLLVLPVPDIPQRLWWPFPPPTVRNFSRWSVRWFGVNITHENQSLLTSPDGMAKLWNPWLLFRVKTGRPWSIKRNHRFHKCCLSIPSGEGSGYNLWLETPFELLHGESWWGWV